MEQEYQPTIDVDLSTLPDADSIVGGQSISQQQRSRIEPANGGQAKSVSSRFEEATRRLLRQRLFIATSVWISFGLLIWMVDMSSGRSGLEKTIVKLTTLSTLAIAAGYLFRTETISLRRLRLIEVLIGLIAVGEMMFIAVSITEDCLRDSKLETIPVVRVAICSATSLFIAIYGMFIPSNWRRTAVVTFSTAITPLLVFSVHEWLNKDLAFAMSTDPTPSYVFTIFTLTMAGVATLGSQIVHRTRRQVVEAQQYGQYKLLNEIGRGGMGVVYKAEHSMLKRPAAIKLIRGDSASDPNAIENFEREVHLSATLTHWNTVQVYDYGRTESGDFYYVMEYLEGQTLTDALTRANQLDVPTTLEIACQICDGLAEAHAHGMIHRDLKPSNIFLSSMASGTSVVKILDFGLATTIDQSQTPGRICGTPLYMSPEQAQAKTVDHRSDLYSLGCLIFECLTGKPPFSGKKTLEIVKMQINDQPNLDRLEQIESRLTPIITRCLMKQPGERYESAQELKKVLLNIAKELDLTPFNTSNLKL